MPATLEEAITLWRLAADSLDRAQERVQTTGAAAVQAHRDLEEARTAAAQALDTLGAWARTVS